MTAIDEILELSESDRLNCMEQLWSSLRSEKLESPKWHGEVLKRRRQSLESGEAKSLSIEELKAELDARKSSS